MASALNAYFGSNTWAMLKECAICKKPYRGIGYWHTFECKEYKSAVYFIICDECQRKRDDA